MKNTVKSQIKDLQHEIGDTQWTIYNPMDNEMDAHKVGKIVMHFYCIFEQSNV